MGLAAMVTTILATPSSAVIDGAPYPSDNTGVMQLNIGGLQIGSLILGGHWCSGTPIRKDWVLTAKHCVHDGTKNVNGSTIVARTATRSQIARGLRVATHVKVDVAMVKLSSNIQLNAPWVNAPGVSTIQHRLSTRLPSAGSKVKCWGYGLYRDRYNPGGSDVLRYGIFNTLYTGSWAVRGEPEDYVYVAQGFSIKRNGGPPRYEQITIFGDSGGPCFEVSDSAAVNGIISAVSHDINRPEAYIVGSVYVRDWIVEQLIRFGTSGGMSNQPVQSVGVEEAGINSHAGGGNAWCPNGSFITSLDLDAANTRAHDSPVIGKVGCSRLKGAEFVGWELSRWVPIERAGRNSHSTAGGPFCPNGMFITQIDLDSAPTSGHDSPVIGQVRCAGLRGYSRWSSTTGWLEIGSSLSHFWAGAWCPDGSFLTQIDLDRSAL